MYTRHLTTSKLLPSYNSPYESGSSQEMLLTSVPKFAISQLIYNHMYMASKRVAANGTIIFPSHIPIIEHIQHFAKFKLFLENSFISHNRTVTIFQGQTHPNKKPNNIQQEDGPQLG